MIREAAHEDLPAISRLYRQLHPRDPIPADGADRAVFDLILATPAMRLMVLEVDGTVVVDEALRGTGLGKQIMAATLRAAWEAGCYKAMLLTGSTTPATHAFYRGCGFSPDAKTAYLARP